MTNLERICKMMERVDNGEELSRRKTYIKSSVFYGDGKGIYRKTWGDKLDILTAIKVEDVWVLNNGGKVGELVSPGYRAALYYLSERSKDPNAMSKRKELPLVSGARVKKTYTYGFGTSLMTHNYIQCVGIYTPVQSLVRGYSDAEAKYEALKKKDGVRGTKYRQVMEDTKWVIERLLASEIESGIADV